MGYEKLENYVIDFLKEINLEKVKGIQVNETCDENTFFGRVSKEDFFNKYCEELELYTCCKFYDYDFPYVDFDLIQDYLEDYFIDFIENLGLNETEFDELLDFFKENDLIYLIDRVCKNG